MIDPKFSCFDTNSLVAHGWTQTHNDSIYCANIASCGKTGHVTLTTPLPEVICHHWLRLAMVNLSMKYEVSITKVTKI